MDSDRRDEHLHLEIMILDVSTVTDRMRALGALLSLCIHILV